MNFCRPLEVCVGQPAVSLRRERAGSVGLPPAGVSPRGAGVCPRLEARGWEAEDPVKVAAASGSDPAPAFAWGSPVAWTPLSGEPAQRAPRGVPPPWFPKVFLWKYVEYQMAVSPGEKLLLWDCFVLLCFLSAVVRKNICLGLSVKLMLVKELTSIFFPRFIRLANLSSNWKTKHKGARRVKNSLLFRFRSSWRSWCNSVILAVIRSSFPPPPQDEKKGEQS